MEILMEKIKPVFLENYESENQQNNNNNNRTFALFRPIKNPI